MVSMDIDVHEYPWRSLDIHHGCPWLNGYIGLSSYTCGRSMNIHLDICGSMDIRGCPWVWIMSVHGMSTESLETDGFPCTTIDILGHRWKSIVRPQQSTPDSFWTFPRHLFFQMPQLQGTGTRYQVPGTKYNVPGTRHQLLQLSQL